MLTVEFKKKFFEETDHTGRHMVISFRTGKRYYIEAIEGNKVKWGDLNPATGKLEGSYGEKYRGAIDKDESLITEENGFDKVHELPPGTSPAVYIEGLDAQYPDRVNPKTIEEGKVRKGGVNEPPTTGRPPPPQGQGS